MCVRACGCVVGGGGGGGGRRTPVPRAGVGPEQVPPAPHRRGAAAARGTGWCGGRCMRSAARARGPGRWRVAAQGPMAVAVCFVINTRGIRNISLC